MNKKLASILSLSALTLALGACEQHEHRMELAHQRPGSYETTESITDAKGTTMIKTSTTTVTVDDEGNRKEVITTKITKDPKGWMNKKTVSKTSETTEQK